MIRASHVITGLGTGGAESMLVKLLGAVDRDQFAPSVVSLTGRGDMADRIEATGVKVTAIGMVRSTPSPVAFFRLRRELERTAPDIVQSWMYHADLLGGLAARSLGIRRIVWSLRQSNLSREANRWSTLATIRACALASSWLPARIVCGSEAARESHARAGYASDRMIVIPNGFDLAAFRPSAESRASIRESLGVAPERRLVGLVARFDPQKDHRNFAAAAGLVLRQHPDVRFVLCGEGVAESNRELVQWLRDAGALDACHLLGRRTDVATLTAAFDVAVSSSFGEGFPNTVGEAMACEVPCVVTNVGDSAAIVGETGIVVPPRDPGALAGAIASLLDAGETHRRELGTRARARVESVYGLDTIARRWEALWTEVATCAV